MPHLDLNLVNHDSCLDEGTLVKDPCLKEDLTSSSSGETGESAITRSVTIPSQSETLEERRTKSPLHPGRPFIHHLVDQSECIQSPGGIGSQVPRKKYDCRGVAFLCIPNSAKLVMRPITRVRRKLRRYL